MSLINIHHQGCAQNQIQRALASGRLPHAYIFHGPDGVGKEKLALGLGELLLCSDPVSRELDGEEAESVGASALRMGCGECEDCRAVAADTHPDMHLIYRQLSREHPDAAVRSRKALEIGVDVLRHFVIERVGLTPVRGRAKVFVIREADRITAQAQNALLKTLEEPPAATFLILLVASVDRLLPTTLSRCQLVRFDALPTAFVRRHLTELFPDVPSEQVDFCAASAAGSCGLAVSRVREGVFEINTRLAKGLADLPDLRPDKQASWWLETAKALAEHYRKADPDITETEATRRGLKSLLNLSAGWFGDVLRVGSGQADGLLNSALNRQLSATAKRMSVERAAEAIQRVVATERQLDLNVNVQLCVETLLNDLARVCRGERIEAA